MKKIISWLYHKYVNRPYDYSKTSFDSYMEIHKRLYDQPQNFKVNTFEEYSFIEGQCRLKYLIDKFKKEKQ